MKKILWFFCLLQFGTMRAETASNIQIPTNLQQNHPRTATISKDSIRQLIREEAWAKDVFDKIKGRTDGYHAKLQTDSQWLVSRLQMYWKNHWTEIYIKGEKFAYAGGEKAPVPTVRYSGARSTTTLYGRPKLEEVLPFMEDERGLYLINNSKPNKPFEWADPAETGRNIESINREVMGIARDAAFLYWLTDNADYALLAREVFDVYMTGMYYRNAPIDLNHGHQQTLVGLSSFEVIHEDILSELVPLYDFLYDDLKKNKPEKMPQYAATFKKWADILIENGVPHNNWDLFKSSFVLNIALILDDDQAYSDKKGRQFYIDYILNRSSIRQWSLPRLMEYGFDENTGIWAECPGYSMGVVADFANFISWFDRNLNYDLLPQFPVLAKAVSTIPQYLYPSGYCVGFGDTHPEKIRNDFFIRMIANAQRYGKMDQERQFTSMLKLFDPNYTLAEYGKSNIKPEVSSFFADRPVKLNPEIAKGKIEEYVSPTFWAPNVSWLVQRNGMDAKNSLMISLNGSEGNHMHANGISMELYGKGYTMAPDAGIGSNYFSLDYAEYYSQFPAHNTVCVDGISSYPVMKSNHAFDLMGCYPPSGVKDGIYQGITFSDIRFLEPESNANQNRLTSIITTGDKSGYYIDIFRSGKVKGGDKMHDYFYHNLGQKMVVNDAFDGKLDFMPTEDLTFAGAHLNAYSYLYDKKSVVTTNNIKATFTISMPDENDLKMSMWMKGDSNREWFTALAPMCEGLSRIKEMPYNIKDTPMLTFVARQKGEAWTHPFVSVFEPCSKNEPSTIASVSYFDSDIPLKAFVGIKVTSKSGRTDVIFSNTNNQEVVRYEQMRSQSTYSVVGCETNGNCIYFMGSGLLLSTPDVSISTKQPCMVALTKKDGKWYYTANSTCEITLFKKKYQLPASTLKVIE